MQNIIRPKYLIVILMLAMLSPGCSLLHKSSRRKTEKKMEQKDEKVNKAFDKGLKQHVKNQSKQTVKMMKKTKRRSDKLNRSKKRKPFWKTIF